MFVKKMKAEGGLATTSELNGVFTIQEMEIVLAMLKEERIPVVDLDCLRNCFSPLCWEC